MLHLYLLFMENLHLICGINKRRLYILNKELEILKLQNRIVLLRGRTEKDNKNIQKKCLRKLKKLQEQ